jgi:hypothetical protein
MSHAVIHYHKCWSVVCLRIDKTPLSAVREQRANHILAEVAKESHSVTQAALDKLRLILEAQTTFDKNSGCVAATLLDMCVVFSV